jgi:branched-chain amino acid transport system substrate-binding protein
MRLATCKAPAACLLTLSLAALSACGGNGGSEGGAADASDGAGGKVVAIYSSLPMRGPAASEAASLVRGIKLALDEADGRAGRFTVQYTPLDDSTGPAGWDASQTAANARKVAADPRAVYYIGEFDDNASEVSMPILNAAGIPQVSPANTYVGLTTKSPGGASNEPGRYRPTGTRTYLRIVPSDSIQAAADLEAMKQAGCTKAALADDGEPSGVSLTKLIEIEKGYYGIDVVSDTGLAASS